MPPRLSGPVRLIRGVPTFGRFWAASLASYVGDAMAWIALPWFVLRTTGSATATAGVLLALELPAILTGALAGSLMDRLQPRRLIALDNALRMLVFVLVPLLYWLGGLSLGALYLLATVAGALQPITLVGARTMLPELVTDEGLDGANTLMALGDSLSVVVGPAAAGVLVAAAGAPAVLLVDAASFALMAVVALSLPVVARSGEPAQSTFAERIGLGQLWRLRIVRVTTLLSLVFFFSYGPLEAAMPVYSARVLLTDARGFGLLWTALGVGMLVGTLFSATLARRVRVGVALPAIALLWGVCLLPLLVVARVPWAALCLALGGLVWGPYTPMETTLLQRSVPRDQRGRVFGARATLLTSGAPLGIAVGGAMLAFLPSTALIALSGLACVLVGVAGLWSRTLRRAGGGREVAEVEA
jgi:MFS family permease